MRLIRWTALLLALMMLLASGPISAAELTEDWLIPKTRDYPPFTDTAGTGFETAAATCCQAGLMDGVDSRHFLPTNGLSYAQIIVISARLHKLLTGGSLEYFEPISLKGADWWKPYDSYLQEQLPNLAEDTSYAEMTAYPTSTCYRESFLSLLADVLDHSGTVLPEMNAVDAVPDCCDQELIQFYRWGVLGGKDAYGTLFGSAPLSRGAAAAMLARLIDPSQRLRLELQQLELCQELLTISPETELMAVSGQGITAEEFMPLLVSIYSDYNHAHFRSMMLELQGLTPLDVALDQLRAWILCETLAQELGLEVPPAEDSAYFTGYQGLTAHGQAWADYHTRLYQAVLQALGEEAFPSARAPQPEYGEIWETLDFSDLSNRVYTLPYWGCGLF